MKEKLRKKGVERRVEKEKAQNLRKDVLKNGLIPSDEAHHERELGSNPLESEKFETLNESELESPMLLNARELRGSTCMSSKKS